jgi:GNAT superfamily N-acetyltransferase
LRAVDAQRAERLGIHAYRSALPETLDLPGAIALRATVAPESPMLNRIAGLGLEQPATEQQLDGAIAAMAGLRHYVSLSPSARPAEIAAWLRARGYEPSWGWMQFQRGVGELTPAATALTVAEIGPDDGVAFARIVTAAFGLPAALEPAIARLAARTDWQCWLALAGDEPAAAGALFAEEGAGYLGLAATAPEHRGKGGQCALLAARIRRARELGCDTVYVETGERIPDRPSASYRNILRAGFEELHVVPNWISPPGTAQRA